MINLEKEIRQQPDTVAAVKENCYNSILEIVQKIKESDIKYVYFAARGTSDHACIYAKYLFETMIGIPCGSANPSVLTKLDGKLCLKNALVIGVSQSGAAEDVLAVINRAKRCDAITLAITNTEGSPVATAADHHIYLGVGKENSIAATKTFTAQIAVMALICAAWSGSERLLNAYDEVPRAISKLLDYLPAQIEKVIGDFAELDSGVVLGRGYNCPIALEGALKIMETNNINMRGYSVADFYHGPFAQLTHGGNAFLLASSGAMLEDCQNMLKKLRTTPTRVLVFTDDEQFATDEKYKFVLPKLSHEALSPFVFVLAMQCFALKLTEVKGIDPDKSDVIKKVTVTK